jgi:hypothetical protein
MTVSLFRPCPRCGAEELSWRVYRPAPGAPLAARELRWTCRACSHEWREPLDRRIGVDLPIPPVPES